ncbi:hypothetical protein PV325_007860 [Microctonus aethiopoides]|nr:hypothetical protein PV325_007860 [Microctonus aethiopoides]
MGEMEIFATSKTYNIDAQVGESSACATALLCGVKANYETVGLDASAKFDNCLSSKTARVPSIVDWAQERGKSTGFVTTTRVTHATPAALYAHAPSRYWEDDGKVPSAARVSCKDIAKQLLEDEPGRNINVILGGGRRHFVSKVTQDPEEPDKEGRRLDGRNLITEWMKNHQGPTTKYVYSKEQFEDIDPARVDHLLGLFAYSHMDFDVDRNTTGTGDPSLTEMTIKALRILKKNPNGYFLFVEGGRIDHAHHYNNAYRALDETLAMEEAVRAVMAEVDLTETLLVVTADHSHVLTLGGLATLRGNPIFDSVLSFTENWFSQGSDSKKSDVDGKPYTTLLYSNGPGHTEPRSVMREAGKDSIQTAGVPRTWATHGGEDVPVFAIGPLANILFSGSIDQSYIPHAIAYAACMGRHASRCSHESATNNDTIIAAISCPSAEPNSAAISSDVMNDQARNPPSKSSNNGVVSGGSNIKLHLSLQHLLALTLESELAAGNTVSTLYRNIYRMMKRIRKRDSRALVTKNPNNFRFKKRKESQENPLEIGRRKVFLDAQILAYKVEDLDPEKDMRRQPLSNKGKNR